MSAPKTLIILPAYNEAANIVPTIEALRAHAPSADILVIDDGSGDATSRVARQAGAVVLSLPYNVGIGAAVQTGFQYAASHAYERVVRNDGDGQHDPASIPRLLATLTHEGVDMVVGSRFLVDGDAPGGDYGTSAARLMGIRILCALLGSLTHQPITDPTSGFTAYNRRAIQLFARDYPHDYPEPEAIIILHRHGLRLCEVPVKMRARQHGRSSITPLRSAYYMLKVILAILIQMLRRTSGPSPA